MKHTKLYIRFFIELHKESKRGLCPIRCNISFNKAVKRFSTGVFVAPDNWSAEYQKVSDKDADQVTKNGLLQTISSKLLKIELELQLNSDTIDVESIYNNYKGVDKRSVIGVAKFYKNYLDKIKRLIDKDIKESTWNKFKYINDHVSEFVKDNYGTDIPINKLNISFLEEFEYWLKTTKHQKQITVNKTIQRFRKPFRLAVNEGLLTVDPFTNHKTRKVSTKVVFLTKEELHTFETEKLIQKRLDIVRKQFVFCCYSGLAYAEMAALNRSHIQKGFDGRDWINIMRQKTGKDIAIPLLPKAEIILKDLGFYQNDGLPKLSNQKFNSYLKEISAILNIDKRLTHHTARKTFASTVLLYNNVPMEIVQKLLGHSSITITEQSYGRILQRQISEQMARFYPASKSDNLKKKKSRKNKKPNKPNKDKTS